MDEQSTVMGLLARRVRMTEGQLYTAILAIVVVLLLTLTGLPNARRSTAELPGAGAVPVPPPSTTVATTVPEAP